MLSADWRPHPAGLIRLGSPHDGGYVISPKAVEATTLLIGLGLNDNWSFEREFHSTNPVRVICYDHTVDFRLWIRVFLRGFYRLRPSDLWKYLSYKRFFRGPVEHRKQCIGYDASGAVSLATILAGTDSNAIFLKCDIEGAEYRILDDIVANRKRFTGIVMELHSVDLHRDRIDQWLAAMRGFSIVALHANNYGGVDLNGDPLTLEITLTREGLVEQGASARHRSNDPTRPEIEMHFLDPPSLRAVA